MSARHCEDAGENRIVTVPFLLEANGQLHAPATFSPGKGTWYPLCRYLRGLDIIHRPALYLKHDISETGFCLRLQVETTQMGPIQRSIFSECSVLVFVSVHTETCSIYCSLERGDRNQSPKCFK
jgi:hypothetical protein